jgi:hypothetical protein
MKPETITALKEEMGYTEEQPARCKDCVHSSEHENSMLERSWMRQCNLAALGPIPVADHGVCNKFNRKPKL